jgi:putative peptide zinc metalloprotease protein
MNIVRALDVALPELPQQIIRKNPPQLDPRVIAKEHYEKGQPVVLTKIPGSEFVFRFTPAQWTLIQMFDGVRTPEEIGERFTAETGTPVTADEVRELASFLQSNSKLLYKTPMEQNITLQEELRASRGKKRRRFAVKDLSDITLKTWDNADKYITWLYPKVRFLFTPWFVWTSIGMFILMGWMWADRFAEVWADSFAFYNFTEKSGSDLIEFWFLFGGMAAIHETSHGLVGKHFGAQIEKMGFSLLYFAPTFFCDATQVWVMAGKWARIATAIAGIWLDLVVCFFATVVWWSTPTGMTLHDFAYKVMMVTGVGVSLLNLNPLIKLDGYLIFSELVAEPSLKETTTVYLSAWVRKYLFRLPVEVPYVPRRKRPLYVVYGVLSGVYSYSLLSFLMIVTYHILRSFTPEWAFLPALAIGFWVFKSRVKLLVAFMKTLYLDKKERVISWLTPIHVALISSAALVVLLAPIWPDFVPGPFLLKAKQSAVLRAAVPGTVIAVSVEEGSQVAAGALLLQLRNSSIESESALAQSELRQATARANTAALLYTDFAGAEEERQHRLSNRDLATERTAKLSVISPLAGVVMTPHPSDLVGRSVSEGDMLLEVNDLSHIKADVYIPEFQMHDVRVSQPVRLLVYGRVRPLAGVLSAVAPASSPATGLLPKDQLQGINPPRYYVGTVLLANDAQLNAGMTGSAKVLVARRSLLGFAYRFSRDLVRRKIW